MKVRQHEDDIVIRIPRKLYGRKLRNILSHIEHLKIVSGSVASEPGISKLLSEIKIERGKMIRSYLKGRGVITR